MAKRFSDTEKWKKPLLRSLPTEYKLLWIYILDDCDHAGIWHVDEDIASLRIGKKISIEKAEELFSDQITSFDDGNKWFINGFIDFQYGELRDNNKAHISVIRILTKYNLLHKTKIGYETPINNNIKGKARLSIFNRDGYKCCYCNNFFDIDFLEPDHIVPLNLGGRNDIKNVVTSCKTCNRKKSDLNLDDFIQKFSLDKSIIYKNIEHSRGLHTPNLGVKDMDMDKDMDKDMVMDKDKDKSELDFSIVPEFMKEGIELWLKHKKEKRQNYKPTGFKIFVENCQKEYKTKESFLEAVKFSVGKNYDGLYKPKETEQKQVINPINQTFHPDEYKRKK